VSNHITPLADKLFNETPPMSMDPLARRIIDLSVAGQSTVVLVTPGYFSLRPGFFVELVRTIEQVSLALPQQPESIEIDCYQQPGGLGSLLSDRRLRRQAIRLKKRMSEFSEIPVSVRWTAILARPSKLRPLVIGCCDSRQPLPPWAAAVELSGRPQVA
jgi:hypothetical protein